MKRVISFALALLIVLGAVPMAAGAVELDGEDPVLDYGALPVQPVERMGGSVEQTYEMADIPEGGSYVTMSTSQEMIDVIKDFEGFSATPYEDNTQWTVGYGSYCGDYPEDPKPNITLTEDEAEERLRKDLSKTYEPIVNNFCEKNGKQPTQQQFDALLDLTYNVGGSWTSGSAVPDVVLNASTALEIVQGFGAWSRSGGKVSYVHVNRRIREALIFLYGEYYRAYGNQDCKSDIEVVSNDDLPHFKAVIFKTNYGTLPNGRTDYAGYYAVDEYYGSFLDATRSGYTLVGWKITKRSNESVSDGEKISIYDKVSENLELTAMWEYGDVVVEPDEPPADYVDPDEPAEPDALPFSDVSENAWFYDAVKYVYENEYMRGLSATTFAPDEAMTRGMLVTVLYRLDGSAEVTEEQRAHFTDAQGAFYTDAIAWAYANGIVKGVTDTTFEPNRIVTRQEAVTIFHRYCVDFQMLDAGGTADLSGYSDSAQVAAFAKTAFAWAVEVGLVEGSVNAGVVTLRPADALNRAQAATLLMRCVEEILYV